MEIEKGSSEASLTAVVFILGYRRAFRSDKFMGRAGHKLALELIGKVNAPLSDELHDFSGISPFTATGIFQLDAHHHWLRITAMRPDIVKAVNELTKAKPFTLCMDDWTVEEAIVSDHDWIGQTTPQQLINDHWHPIGELSLEFKTGTAINSLGLYRPLPEPSLIFKSLLERWLNLSEMPLPFTPEMAIFDSFTRDMIAITDFYLTSETIPMKHGSIPAFRGTVNYRIQKNNETLQKRDPDYYERLKKDYQQISSLINLLAHFSFYSGVGIKTAQGMGMVRPMEE